MDPCAELPSMPTLQPSPQPHSAPGSGSDGEKPVSVPEGARKVVVSVKDIEDTSVTSSLVLEDNIKRDSIVTYSTTTTTTTTAERPTQSQASATAFVTSASSLSSSTSFSSLSLSHAKKGREARSEKTKAEEKLAFENSNNKSESLPLLSCQSQSLSSSYSLSSSISKSYSTPHVSHCSQSFPALPTKWREDQAKGKESRNYTRNGGLYFLKMQKNQTFVDELWKVKEKEKCLPFSRLQSECDARTSGEVESNPSCQVKSSCQPFSDTTVSQSPLHTSLRENGLTSNSQAEHNRKSCTSHTFPSNKETHDQKKSQGEDRSVSHPRNISTLAVDDSSSTSTQHGDTRTEKTCAAKEVLVNYEKETDRASSRTVHTPSTNTEAVKVSPRLRKEYKVVHITSSGLMRKKNQVFV